MPTGARKTTGTGSKPTRKRKAEDEEDEDAMDEEDEEDEDAMDEEQRTGPMSPMTAREMEAAVESTLNMLFSRVGVDDVPFDELYKTLIRKVPRAILTGREAVEEALVKMVGLTALGSALFRGAHGPRLGLGSALTALGSRLGPLAWGSRP
jgi:hypothetical protein